MNGLGIVVIILVGIAIIGGAWYAHYLREKFWKELAAELGLEYRPGDPFDLHDSYPFQIFRVGSSRRTSHTLAGNYEGCDVILFDYQYTTGSGKNKSTHHLSGLIQKMPCDGRAMNVRPENFLDRFASFFGFDDINFELEEFNRAFRVHCEDKKLAYDVFHTGMMDYMMAHRSATLEWQGRNLLVVKWGRSTFNRQDVLDVLDIARGFKDHLPEYLLAQS